MPVARRLGRMPVAGRLRAEARAGGAAVAFLTRLPADRLITANASDLARAAPAFPVVGAALGAAVGAAASLLAGPCPPAVAAGVALALGAIATGGIHLDGLADTADALGARSREQALAIMRDPRIGSYGASALVLGLLVEAGALASLAERGAVVPAMAAFGLSRAVAPVLASLLPYARPGAGLAQSLARASRIRAGVGALVACTLVAALEPSQAPLLIAAAVACCAAAWVLCRRRFGGVTGDTLGAAIVVTEATCLVIAASG
jgi:adenosylcobinamide-GDP ribazoletransferase